MARKTDYNSEFHDEQAYKFCLLGKTAKELAELFGVSHQTIKNWFKQHPSFFASVTRGREIADAEVAAAFFKRATGFEVDTEKVVVVSVGDFISQAEVVKHKTYFPPDAGAALNWLKNRQPDQWRDKVDVDLPPKIVLTMHLDGDPNSSQQS